MNWWGQEWHKVFTVVNSAILVIVHWEEALDKLARIVGLRHIVERAGKDRRHLMNIMELPEFVKAATKLATDLKAAESSLAPQFPQIIADAENVKTVGEKLLGIQP